MNSQTVDQTDLAGLDFDIPCQVRWGKTNPGRSKCGEAEAVADIQFHAAGDSVARKFACESCIADIAGMGRLLSATYI